jgi:hypothetical protein
VEDGGLGDCFLRGEPSRFVFSSPALPSAGQTEIVSRGRGDDGLGISMLGVSRVVLMVGQERKIDQKVGAKITCLS